MSCSCSSACPDAVPTVNRTEISLTAFPDVTVDATLDGDTPNLFRIRAEVSDHGDLPWLVRFWFTKGSTIAEMNKEAITAPEVPGVSQFFKVTAIDGTLEFDVSNPGAGTWYLCAAVVGYAASTKVMEFT